MNLPVVQRILGLLLMLFSLTMLPPMVVSLHFHDGNYAPFMDSAVVLLSHCHWDHIIGLSFFAPIQTPGWKVRVLAGHLADKGGVGQVFASAYGPGPTYPHPIKNWYATETTSFEDCSVFSGAYPGRPIAA